MTILEEAQITSPLGPITLQKCRLDDSSEIAEMEEIPTDLYADIQNPYGDGEGIYFRAWWTAENGQQCGEASITEAGAVSKAIASAGRWWAQNNSPRLNA